MTDKTRKHTGLEGCGVLIVEDEAMVAIVLEDLLLELGCRVVGTVARVETALASVAARNFDVAILDVNLKGESSYPIADALERENMPFLFVTGYGSGAVPGKYRKCAILQKPFKKSELAEMLLAVLS
ncbi:MAG TPA: response regulator [Methylocella sp.]|nr:response regulator [Methylocella sp.]